MNVTVFVFVFASACVGACSLAALDGFTGGGGANDAGIADGTTTTTAAESGTSDVVVMEGGATPRGCAAFPDATFCEDFDSDQGLAPARWDRLETMVLAGGISLSTEHSVSEPASARFLIVTTPTSCEYVQAIKAYSGLFRRVQVGFDVRLESAGIFAALRASVNPSLDYNALLEGYAGGDARARLQEAGQVPSDVRSEPLAGTTSNLGRWLAVSLEIDMDSRTATATYGPERALFTLPAEYVLRDPSLQLGPYCADGNTSFHVDNVVIRLTP